VGVLVVLCILFVWLIKTAPLFSCNWVLTYVSWLFCDNFLVPSLVLSLVLWFWSSACFAGFPCLPVSCLIFRLFALFWPFAFCVLQLWVILKASFGSSYRVSEQFVTIARIYCKKKVNIHFKYLNLPWYIINTLLVDNIVKQCFRSFNRIIIIIYKIRNVKAVVIATPSFHNEVYVVITEGIVWF